MDWKSSPKTKHPNKIRWTWLATFTFLNDSYSHLLCILYALAMPILWSSGAGNVAAENPQQRMGCPEVILREQRNHCWITWLWRPWPDKNFGSSERLLRLVVQIYQKIDIWTTNIMVGALLWKILKLIKSEKYINILINTNIMVGFRFTHSLVGALARPAQKSWPRVFSWKSHLTWAMVESWINV